MNAGESPRNQGLSVKGAPVRFRRRSRGLRKNAAVERREVNALRTGVRRKAYRCYPRLSALRSPHIVREHSPRERGGGKSRRTPRLARTGAAELWVFCA